MTQKLILLVAISVCFWGFWPNLSQAQLSVPGGTVGQQGGGFSGPGLAPSTAQEAIKARDDSYVILKGQIVRHLGKDKYLFRDVTGEINVDIDRDKWLGQTVTPETTVEIRGEIDKDWNSVEVDVDQITIVK
ncbi:MAG: NirD/YgiW/YdeI family stress tolerance protein [Deltaproteobacteria bacterium]|jgi:uncharacterized protein (TIGR00156 family)|nr:NirD/YgiW/YdeI family stress tolerance protein [Deltaproteobacteria bacterium]